MFYAIKYIYYFIISNNIYVDLYKSYIDVDRSIDKFYIKTNIYIDNLYKLQLSSIILFKYFNELFYKLIEKKYVNVDMLDICNFHFFL